MPTPAPGTDATAMPTPAPPVSAHDRWGRDSLIVVVGGQLERLLGLATALALRWGLDPARLGVYTGLRLFLDNTNRSSLGVGLGAVQQIPILRAQGRVAEARHVANVAHTANTLTCLAYALGLLAFARFRPEGALASEWTGGLIAIAGLTLLRRYESFLIAVLRAHGEFRLTTELDVFESLVSALAVGLGLWCAGFFGLLAAVGVILTAKIAFLHARHPLRFAWAWDGRLLGSLMLTGLPILANTAAFGCVVGLDRALILGLVPDGERSAGLYTVALLGTGWSLDLAGRIVLVLYTQLQTTLGRTADPAAVALAAARATEVQAPLLALGGAVAYVLAPGFLGWLIPRYAEGLPALRPLLPGAVILGLAWPARQLLIAIGRPYRLLLATAAGLAITAALGVIGARHAGIVGVAAAMSLGYLTVFLATSRTAFRSTLGAAAWRAHLGRLAAGALPFAMAAGLAAHLPLPATGPVWEWLTRGLMLALAIAPPAAWAAHQSGLLEHGRAWLDRRRLRVRAT